MIYVMLRCDCMELPVSIEIYRGFYPFSLFLRSQAVMACQANKSYECFLSEKVRTELYVDANTIFTEMRKKDLDDVTVEISNDLRIDVVEKFSSKSYDEYEECTYNICYKNNMWTMEVLRSSMPTGFKSGHYRCSMRIDAKYGFWNRNMKDKRLLNNMATVLCKLYLIIHERTGDTVSVAPKSTPFSNIWRELCAQFRSVFEI